MKKLTKHQKRLLFKMQRKDTLVTDRTAAHYCWLHPIHIENKEHPTENDLKKLAKIELKPWKMKDAEGVTHIGRSCPSCGNTVEVSQSRALLHPGLEGFTEKQPAELDHA
jgi:ribosomal protein S27AE